MFFVGVCTLAFASVARNAEALDEPQERLIAEEAMRLQQTNGAASRTGDVLTVRITNGKTLRWRNENQCGDDGLPVDTAHCVKYIYVDHVVRSHGFVILGLGCETFGYEWVDDATGTRTQLPDEPHPSPSANRIAVVSESEDGGYNGIQVWVRRNGSLVLEWHHEPEAREYALYEFKGWKDDDTVLMSVTTGVGDGLKDLPARAVRHPQWKYEGPVGRKY
jgi:hypothetical protein